MYIIKGKYMNEPWEEIDEFDTLSEAKRMTNEYKMAYGAGWQFSIKRKKEAK